MSLRLYPNPKEAAMPRYFSHDVFTLLEKVVVVCRDGAGDTDTEISQQRQFDPSRYEKCGRRYPFYLVPITGYISKYSTSSYT